MERIVVTEKDGKMVISKETLPELTWREDLQKHLTDMGLEGDLTFVADKE